MFSRAMEGVRKIPGIAVKGARGYAAEAAKAAAVVGAGVGLFNFAAWGTDERIPGRLSIDGPEFDNYEWPLDLTEFDDLRAVAFLVAIWPIMKWSYEQDQKDMAAQQAQEEEVRPIPRRR